MAARELENLAEALGTKEFTVEPRRAVGGEEALVGRRSDFSWSWFGARLHPFVVAFAEIELTTARAVELTAAAQEFAIKHKGGLPRGLQTGTATLATFLCRSPSDDLTEWFRAEPQHRYAALRLPVLLDLDARKLTWFSGRMSRGFLYQQHLNQIVRDVIEPGVNRGS
jgi:hypothetical protein